MTATRRPAPLAGTDALLRQIDHHMANLRFASQALPAQRGEVPPDPALRGWDRRFGAGIDLGLAERIARSLRRLVLDTAQSSAADRARVRAAVHYFVLSRDSSDDRRSRGLVDDLRVVNEIFTELGRGDLVVPHRG